MTTTSVEVLKGTLDLMILRGLSWGPAHGYAVSRWIRQVTEDVLQIEEGALYPALHRLVVCPENDFTLLDFVEDRVDSGAPHERLRVRVVVPQVVFDGHDQFLHVAKDAAPKALLRQLAEPALDQVEPRGAGRREVQLKARMGGQPVAHRLVLVGPVVVEDDVQGQIGRERAVEAPQELQEFLMPMTAVALADDLAGQHVQSGEQRRCAGRL